MAKRIKASALSDLDEAALSELAQAVKSCRILAFPTDTVYGLGSTALVKAASRRIYQIKDRPDAKPLPVMVGSAEDAGEWIEWTPMGRLLARKFWPGLLTLVMKPTAKGRALTFAEYKTIGIRVPGHPVLAELLRRSGIPWATTSANRSGRSALVEGQAVWEEFKDEVDFILDGGRVPGTESTVVDVTGPTPRILREGAIPAKVIMDISAPVGSEAAGGLQGARRILFVCTGNTCRSVMAEQIFKKIVGERGLDVRAGSAGLAADPRYGIPDQVRDVLAREGVASFSHTPTLVSRDLVEKADLVFAMTESQRQRLVERFPEAFSKIFLLGGYAGLVEPEVGDPIGLGADVYGQCLDRIKEALLRIVTRAPMEKMHGRA
jgi:tRNA threonylcarbamoyl adenosine modification protein (Sua5/YciO/YrdC/YwlC family)